MIKNKNSKLIQVGKNEVGEFRCDGHFSILFTDNGVLIYSDDNFDYELESNEKHYKHKCDSCIFLGNWTEYGLFIYDLYFCNQDNLPTVIARYGNDPSHYHSGLNMQHIKALQVAEQQAKLFNLI